MTEETHHSKLGLLGGSFDPIHAGHIAIARAARDRHRLERLIFIPNRNPPHKGIVAPANDRYQMVCIAVLNEAGFEATDQELRREGPSYTVDTLREIRQEQGEGCEIFFVVGSDSLPEMPTWREFPEVVRLSRIVPVSRPGFPFDVEVALGGTVTDDVLRRIEADSVVIDTSPISSTKIRDRVREGQDLEDLVPPGVKQYIREHGLYREKPSP